VSVFEPLLLLKKRLQTGMMAVFHMHFAEVHTLLTAGRWCKFSQLDEFGVVENKENRVW